MNPLVPPLYEARTADWIRHHIERSLGLTHCTPEELEAAVAGKRCPRFASLRYIRAKGDFEALRDARLRMGHLRYGVCGWSVGDVIGSCLDRLRDYQKSGNREHLVDVANLIEIEWVWPQIEGRYYDRALHLYADFGAAPLLLYLGELGGLHRGNRYLLVNAIDSVTIEWNYPDHPNAHWEALDCGGHWSMRNQT